MTFDITLFATSAGYTVQHPVFRRDQDSEYGPATVVTIRASLRTEIARQVTEAVSTSMVQAPTALDRAVGRVDHQFMSKPLRPVDVARAIRLGRGEEALAMVAKLSNVPPPTVVRAIMYGDINYALRQMLALGIDEVTAGMILRSFGRMLDVGASPSKGTDAYRCSRDEGETQSRPEGRYDLTA